MISRDGLVSLCFRFNSSGLIFSFFCVSAILRIFYSLSYGVYAGGDGPDYTDIAKNLVLNHAFAFTGSSGELIQTAFRPFLYPSIIAALWTGNEAPLNSVVAIQVILGSITVVLTYLIARKHFSQIIAFISALFLALSPQAIQFTRTVLTETVFTFLLVAACYFWGNNKYKIAGVFFGFVFLTRPIIFPFLLLLVFISFFPHFRDLRRNFLVMATIAILVASPWILRNSLMFSQFTLTQSSGYGTNLLYGTIDTPISGDDIWSWITKLPLTQNVEGLNEVEQDRHKLKVAVNRILDNPFEWLRIRTKQYPKLFLDSGDSILGSRSRPISQALKEFDLIVIIIKFGSITACLLLFSLFLIGVVRIIKNHPQTFHIYLLPIFFMLIHLPMWIESRYLLPVMPFVYIIAVYGLTTLKNKFVPYTRSTNQL